MKKLHIILLALLMSQLTFAQKKSLKLSMSYGIYSSTNYDRVAPGRSISFDMNYFISERVFLTSHCNYGNFRYFDDALSNSPGHNIQSDGTNTDAESLHFGLLVGYNINIMKLLNIYASSGISSYTLIRTYPYLYDEFTFSTNNSAWTDLAFPVRIGIELNPWKGFSFGIISGFYIEPDFPIVGWHASPILSYKF